LAGSKDKGRPPGEGTREPQYDILLERQAHHGQERLGLMMNQAWYDDPKRLAFTFARYKFVAKMLAGCPTVLEVGCGDAFPSRIVQQEVGRLTVTDFDPLFIADVKARMVEGWEFADAFAHDMLSGPVPGRYDGIYALDVLEHIDPAKEETFLRNMITSLSDHGTMIIGMPTIESQDYASPPSKEGHVNCQSLPDLRRGMQRFFDNVYMFCMNDEVLHVGYHKMAHYVFALCCSKKSDIEVGA
jgi:cyclopropane fatty-acyl-phospholipid synthase-like methyltransferase